MSKTNNTFRVLSSRTIADLGVALCKTRFGDKVWMITDEALWVNPNDHGGVYLGDRKGAVAFLRRHLDYLDMASRQDYAAGRHDR